MNFTRALLAAAFVVNFTFLAISAETKPFVVFVTGDHEYRSEKTMPLLAQALEKNFGMKTIVLYATRPDGTRDEQYEKSIPGMEILERADLAIFFLRWRQLPMDQLALIQKYLDSGKPLVGFRTTSHSFNFPKDDERAKWNAFGSWAFGTPPGWGANGHTHYGHTSSTDVFVNPNAAGNPILKGVATNFHVRSWLYNVVPDFPPDDAVQLLIGRSVKPEHGTPVENPVAWTWTTSQGARSFYTSMGHPEDFQVESFQRLTVNAIHWALGKPVPEKWLGKLAIEVPYEKSKK